MFLIVRAVKCNTPFHQTKQVRCVVLINGSAVNFFEDIPLEEMVA